MTLLCHYFSRKADCFNRGYSGYNTNYALAVMKKHCQQGIWPTQHALTQDNTETAAAASSSSSSSSASPPRPPSLLTLFFGANDACLPGSASDLQSVPLSQYRSNLVSMVQLIKGEDGTKNPEVHVVIIGPPQCDAQAWGHTYIHTHTHTSTRTGRGTGRQAHGERKESARGR